ncbi:hypothetical protein PUN28_020311 [Cardiocondyla obscurior]|uniref:Secreted protein n=1 Tax=Cardiocondyla obscurior TaxID=286306 RepID=A0AAW2E7V9_9HYME
MLLLLLRIVRDTLCNGAPGDAPFRPQHRPAGTRAVRPNFILFNSRNRTAARRPSADLVELSQAPPNRAVDVEARRFRARRFPGPWRHASGD